MMEHLDHIPDDLPTCQERLRAVLERLHELESLLHDLERQLEETCSTTEELQRSYACLKEEYLALKRLFFGPRRERLPEAPGQQHLFDADTSLRPLTNQPIPRRRRNWPRASASKGHGRREIPDDLPRTDVPHDVPPEARVCDCGREKARIGEDVTEQLEYEPGKLFVFRHIYPKYACSCCKDGVTSAKPAANPIEGGLAGPGLLAYVLVNKFSDHLPLYRQQDVFARHGIFLARSTLCGWMAQCAERLRPLVELMRQRILQSLVINADETPVQVLDRTRDSTRTGYFWVYISPGDHGYTVYDYRDSRNRDGPAEFLKDFRGYLQTDAYASYESVVLESAGRIIPVGCWAHARREFFDARLNQPREVHYVLGLIAQLYDIEDEARIKSVAERLAARQRAERAHSRSVGGILARAASQGVAQEPVCQGDRLCAESLDRAPAVHGERRSGDRQQHFGAYATAVRDRTQKLDVPGERPWTERAASGGALTARELGFGTISSLHLCRVTLPRGDACQWPFARWCILPDMERGPRGFDLVIGDLPFRVFPAWY